jgi:uncharacterized protein (DUF2345 family)
MSVTYDTLTGDTQLIQYVTGAGNTNLYPDSNTIAIAGPIWCPRIYGKDLTAFEIASSGKVAITLNDIHALDFSRASYINSSNYKNTILSQSNYSMALSANSGDLQMVFDAYSNNINITAASNISVTAASGNMTLTTSNNTIVSTSNNFILESHSNINLNAAKGAATISANNSNMFITMEDTNNTLTAYASNEIYISACNNFNVNTKSNINIGTLGGDFKTYADSSNMYLTMEKTTNNVNLFTLSNMYLTASNSVSVTAASNILLGALGGDFKAYAHNSNMYLSMEDDLDKITLYTASNMFVSASNNYNLNAKSNINIGALGGDIQMYSQSSNMFMIMQAATNNINSFASNNMNVSVSNNQNIWVKNNISASTVAGDYRLYVNSSNMFMRMSATTNNINIFSSNNTIFSASNNFNLYALSNFTTSTLNGSIGLSANSSNMLLTMDSAVNTISLFASNNMFIGASNNYNLSAQSNINQGALAGDFNTYADLSNMYLTMTRATDTITMYTSSNMFVSASNNYNLNVKSNILIGGLGGDVKLYSQKSNMFITMSAATNNMAIFASNNLSISVSNSINTWVNSNLTFSTKSGDVQIYANSSNMYLTMDHLTNNTSLFTSNNLLVSVSNSYNTQVNSNLTFSTKSGDVQIYANSSNMYLTMDHLSNNTSLFTSNNLLVSVSNNLNISANSNINVSTTYGSYNLAVNNSNMLLTMDYLTNNTSLFTSNNYQIGVCNNMNVNVKSNLNIGVLVGDINMYANGSNMFLTLNHLNNNMTSFTSNDMNVGASNNYNLNVNSNINIVSRNGDFNVYTNSSNMYLTMNHLTNNVSLFSSNDTTVSVSNNLNIFVQSNIAASANNGSILLYANSSNMFMTMDFTSNNVAVFASNNIYHTACNSYTVIARSNVSVSGNLGSIQLYSASSNMSLVMDAASRNTSIYTSNNMNVSISNNYNVNVQSNINIGTVGGDLKTYADSSNMYLTMEKTTNNVNLFTLSNMYLTASNSVSVTAASNIVLGALGGDFKAYAHNSNMYLTMEDNLDEITLYTASNMFVSASNNYNLNAQSNILMSALGGDVKIYSDKSNMFMTMDHLTDTQTIYTSNQMNLTASNSFALNVQSNIVMNAIVNNITMFASNNVAVTASNSYTLNSRSNISMTALNGDFTVSANSSNMFLSMDHLNKNTTLFSSNNINIGASNKLTVNAQSNMTINANYGEMLVYANSNLKFNADKSNMYMNFNMPSDIIDIYSLSNINVGASNNMFLSASSNISIAASNISMLSYADLFIIASNNITIAASNTLTMSFGSLNTLTSNDQAFTAQSNVKFYINSSSNTSVDPIFTISGNQVLVRGDMVITGDITTSNVFSTTVIQESLKVTDKTIRLANTGSNFNPADGQFDSAMVNGGAGITIDGVPSYWDSNIVNAYDKSLTWNYGSATGTGINQLGTSVGMSNEPFWDMKGGAFQLTHQKIVASGGSNIIQDISFRWRVNELDELEFVKTWWYAASNAYVSRRICRFGRIL